MIILPFRPDASWGHPPIGTIAMMVAILLVHLMWGRGDPESLLPYLLNFQTIDPVQWLTSAFLHAGWMHLVGNLVFLFVFGAIVEDFVGHWFVPVYVLLAIASGALEQCLGLLGHREGLALGASSAIYGLISLAVLWAPNTRVSTFIWLIVYRPMVVEIRVLWLAGGYMAMQILSVLLQGGRPSSEFLHACGIAVGLPLGLLCLRERWVDTHGGDLLAPERPHGGASEPAAPAGVPWEEQLGRLASAVSAGDRRIALAAYDVLRREHPNRLPDLRIMESLVALCEDGLDFHRAAAIGDRAVAGGTSSDAIRLRLARVCGQHLGDAEAGLAHLAAIGRDGLDDASRTEYDRLSDRLQRRRQTVRQPRTSPASIALLAMAMVAVMPSMLLAGDADADPWAAPTSQPDPFAKQPDNAFAAFDKPAEPERRAVLAPVELKPETGRLSVAGGAAIKLTDDLLYLPWQQFRLFLATPQLEPTEDVPLGLIVTGEMLDLLSEDRARVASREEWEQRVSRFLISDGPIQVHWEEGWIDTSEELQGADQLLSDFQMHARLLSRRQAMGPGVSISVDRWIGMPTFNASKGILSWSIQTGFTAPGMMGMVSQISHICHFGSSGTLRLVCDGALSDESVAERMRQVSAQVAWDAGRGFSAKQPKGVGERVGGMRRVMLPRLVFGNPEDDKLVFREDGLGYAWILIALPVVIGVLIFVRRIRSASRPIPAGGGTAPRCPACGSPAPAAASRCSACGKSLVQR